MPKGQTPKHKGSIDANDVTMVLHSVYNRSIYKQS